jgi:hypothetical protein
MAEARKPRITLVPKPTNASHLTPVETRFWTIRRWVLTGSNYRGWSGPSNALRRTIRCLNRVRCMTNSSPAHSQRTRHQRGLYTYVEPFRWKSLPVYIPETDILRRVAIPDAEKKDW